MGIEIERKFRVDESGWKSDARRSLQITQGYISTDPDKTVRVRLEEETGQLTIKGRAEQLVRSEFEYEIPGDDARQLLEGFCGPIIQKVRHQVIVGGHLWEVDEFLGDNAGLVVAEIELESPDEDFDAPGWLGEEVTGEVRYYNARLVDSPFCEWDDQP